MTNAKLENGWTIRVEWLDGSISEWTTPHVPLVDDSQQLGPVVVYGWSEDDPTAEEGFRVRSIQVALPQVRVLELVRNNSDTYPTMRRLMASARAGASSLEIAAESNNIEKIAQGAQEQPPTQMFGREARP
jgi:hypothetical protein